MPQTRGVIIITVADTPDPQRVPLTTAVPGSVDATVTVRLGGDLDIGAIGAMRAEFDRAVRTAMTAIVMDLTGVSFLSLEAAGMLLQVAQRCRDLQLQLLVVPSPAVTRKLTMMGLHDIVPTSSAE